MKHFCEAYYPDDIGSCTHFLATDDLGLCKKPDSFLCTEFLATHLPRLSFSAARSFDHCKMAYKLGYINGIERKKNMLPNAIKLGSVWDEFIQSRATGSHFKDRFTELIDEYEIDGIDAAKIYANIRAYIDLELVLQPGGIAQEEVHLVTRDYYLHGFLDIGYPDYFMEFKYTGRSDFYIKPFTLFGQFTTYFLSSTRFDYGIICPATVPSLRYSDSKEDLEQYSQRIYTDILKRPSHYFKGYNSQTKTWGHTFYRAEFPIDTLKNNLISMTKEIQWCCKNNSWRQDFLSCHVPTECLYLPICTTGHVSDTLYNYRKKEEENAEKTI